jgi:hypothetical protein
MQQNESRSLWWRKYDGQRTDELLRLLRQPRTESSAEMKRARVLAHALIEADLGRVEAFIEDVEVALSLEMWP